MIALLKKLKLMVTFMVAAGLAHLVNNNKRSCKGGYLNLQAAQSLMALLGHCAAACKHPAQQSAD